MKPAATWSIELPLCPEAKGNSRRNFRGRSIKSEKAMQFSKDAILLMRSHHPSPFAQNRSVKLSIWLRVNYPDYRRDVDASLIYDALEGSGVIPNDRQIRKFDVEAEDELIKPGLIRLRLTCIGQLPWQSKAKGLR